MDRLPPEAGGGERVTLAQALTGAYFNALQAQATSLYHSEPSDRPEFLVRQVVAILAEARRKKGLSVNKLARLSGVSPKGITFIEGGTNSPTLRNIFRLAEALEIPVPRLFSEAANRAAPENGD